LADYAGIGVPEAWLLDPRRRTVEVYKLRGDRLEALQVVTEGVLVPERFPGVAVDAAGMWPA
ncbi:MAG: Uma2 family endonuclease, partial [Bryobacteraceae bacterium]